MSVKKNALLPIALMVLVAIFFTLLIYMYFFWLRKFESDMMRVRFMRANGQSRASVSVELEGSTKTMSLNEISADIIFADERVTQEFDRGRGLIATFMVEKDSRDGYQDTTKVVELAFEEKIKDAPSRRNDVNRAKTAFEEALAWFKEPIREKILLLVLVDSTNGIDGVVRQRMRETFDREVARLCGGSLSEYLHSNSLELYAFRVRDFLHMDFKTVFLSSNSAGQTQMQSVIDWWLLADVPPTPKTELIAPLFKGLKEIAGRQERKECFVFSDGLHNSPVLDMYTADLEQQEVLKEAVLKEARKIPNLSDIHIRWFGTPDQSNERKIESALAFWEEFLTEAGAEVEVEY